MIRWLLWALALSALVGLVDTPAFFIGKEMVNAAPAHIKGSVMLGLLAVYLGLGLTATGVLWWRGQQVAAGPRTAGTIAFLLLQGLIVSFMSLLTLIDIRY